MKRPPILIVAAIVLVAGIFFSGGMLLQKALTKPGPQANVSGSTGGGAGGAGFGGRARNGQRPTVGTVTSTGGTTVVVKNNSGSSVTVSLANNPTITDNSGNAVDSSAIQVGSTVLIFGTTGSDGTITAARIRLNPSLGGDTQGATPSGV